VRAITDLETWVHFCRYIFLVGMLMSQFTITGFDACAHMSEETVGADKSAPMAIVMAISVSAIAGFAYILAITFSIQVNTTLLACFHCCLQFCLSLSTHLPGPLVSRTLNRHTSLLVC